MTIGTASLGGTNLPSVHYKGGFAEYPGYRGADLEMASGAMATDLISTSVKRRFELYWVGLTEAQVSTVLTAFATVDDSSASFTSPLGGSYTVTRDYGALELEITWYMAGPFSGSPAKGTAYADVRMRLREV